MRIVQLNLAFDPTLVTPASVLDRYHTLTGWSLALADAGADVTVVQRYSTSAVLVRDRIIYRFVSDDAGPHLPPWTISQACVDTVHQLSPDVVHVNGLMFPAMSLDLRTRIGGRVTIVLQDHSGSAGAAGWLTRFVERRRWRNAFQAVDACTFTAPELAERWRAIGLPAEMKIVEIPEAGTAMCPMAQDEAGAQTGLGGTPAVLWVGRANANKDPAVAVSGFLKASRALGDPHLWMIVPTPTDRKVMEAHLHDVDRSRIHLLEQIPHAQMHRYYSAADLLVSASHHEGSGYAVIEALACGVTPCVTNIPAFRALVGTCGELWTPGDAEACATAIERGARHVSPERRRQVRTHFVTHLSWPAIGRRTLDSYTALHHSHA